MFLSMFFIVVLLIAGFFAYLFLRQKTTVPPRGVLIRNNTVDYLHLFSQQYEIGYSTPTETVFYAIKDIKSPTYEQVAPYISAVDAIFSDGAISAGFNVKFAASGQQIKIGSAGDVVITDFSGQITQIEWIRKSNYVHLFDISNTELDISKPGYIPAPDVLARVTSIKTEGVLTLNLRLVYNDDTFQDFSNPSNSSIPITPSKTIKELQWVPLDAKSQVLQQRLAPKPPAPPIPPRS